MVTTLGPFIGLRLFRHAIRDVEIDDEVQLLPWNWAGGYVVSHCRAERLSVEERRPMNESKVVTIAEEAWTRQG